MLAARKLSSVAIQSAMSTLSTVHRGNAFEERGLKILQDHLSMSLKRVGGKSDGGVDLQGWWWLPPTSNPAASSPSNEHSSGVLERRRLRVLAQCKAEKKEFSPNCVREMEGVLHRYLSHRQSSLSESNEAETIDPLVALLLSESSFTPSTLLRAQSSPVPFFLLHLPPVDVELESDSQDDIDLSQGHIGTAFWNPALGSQRGILGGQIEARWERAIGGGGRPGLWWQDKKLQSWTPDHDVTDLEDGFEVPGL
jgi:Protein of unknown function (DUF2034)